MAAKPNVIEIIPEIGGVYNTYDKLYLEWKFVMG